ncbi:histidine phosphatase family protein [Bacillus sp. CGMCC 1.16607]|uniref:histidine phosphatase family protein n=1 Tax=Bacillus sp. CGMCC 1.16607 TaxID=3351842 RepID=UPI003636CA06
MNREIMYGLDIDLKKLEDKKIMKIILIRHGQSEADLLDVHEGRADFRLTALGVEQAKKLATWMKGKYEPEIIWTSPLLRAKETASIIGEALKVRIKEDEGVKEWNNGVLAGLKRSEAKMIYPEPVSRRKPHERIQNGGSELEF